MATATAERSRLKEGRLGTLAGTGKLLRFHARRTRVFLIGWFAGLAGMNAVIAASLAGVYSDPSSRIESTATYDTPAIRSMTGPGLYLDHYGDSLAVMYAHQMILWSTLMTAVMFILLITRLTRADEETSRLEVIRSLPVGRRADLAAAVWLAVLAGLALGLLVGLSVLGMDGADFGGAMLYGLAHAAVGITFAAITAVAVQIANYSSTSNALGFSALGFGALMSMAGSAAEDPEGSAALWLSPFGWAQKTFAFTPEQTWTPVLVSAVVAAALFWLAFALVAKRDFGQGLRSSRPGRSAAGSGLSSIGALSFRLSRGVLWAGTITLLLLSSSYGAVLGSADDFLDSMPEAQQEVFDQAGGTVTESFLATISLVDAFAAVIFGLLVIGRARKEEVGGRGELLAAGPVPRSGWPGSYLPIAMITASVSVLVGALGLATVGASSLEDGSYFGEILTAGLIHLPAVWVMVAFAFVCLGWLPRAGWLRWLPLVYVFVAGYFGDLIDLPQAARAVSPFEYVPSYPVDDLDWLPLIVLAAVAAALAAFGYAGVRRRDLQFD
ncbi:ABC transporter permease [Glycomyces salinus]|uniref:ABC transporter permease n=1 Tax=Glycomyces salinus TaxID=980294 RepID=UPI0018EB86A3|nr:hypothetical protein [Glycomyces salinus]